MPQASSSASEETRRTHSDYSVLPAPAVQADVRAQLAGGSPLDAAARRTLERIFEIDLSEIRIHADSIAGVNGCVRATALDNWQAQAWEASMPGLTSWPVNVLLVGGRLFAGADEGRLRIASALVDWRRHALEHELFGTASSANNPL